MFFRFRQIRPEAWGVPFPFTAFSPLPCSPGTFFFFFWLINTNPIPKMISSYYNFMKIWVKQFQSRKLVSSMRLKRKLMSLMFGKGENKNGWRERWSWEIVTVVKGHKLLRESKKWVRLCAFVCCHLQNCSYMLLSLCFIT